jgi:hypothetical protein
VSSRRSNVVFWTVALGLVILAAVLLVVWPPRSHEGQPTPNRRSSPATTTVVQRPRRARLAGTPSRRPVSSPVDRRPRVHVSIAATAGPSWVLIRRGSSSGAVVYEGTLAEGDSVRFTGRMLYARFGAIRNLDVQVGRLSVDLSCYGDRGVILTPDGARPRLASCRRTAGS